jgi:hypothetical protein
MNQRLQEIVLHQMRAKKLIDHEVVQELWSGYGQIVRLGLEGCNRQSLIVKQICFPEENQHPQGWNTKASHLRKIKSYDVEIEWYENYSKYCKGKCRVPEYYFSETTESEKLIGMEDLDSVGFSLRKNSLNLDEVKSCLEWLAKFHAVYMQAVPKRLWKIGTYWHLDTREDEMDAMENGFLKKNAVKINAYLNNSVYKTFVHGDAKLANFCFSKSGEIAAVDFQYVGGGCGMKDIAYFLSSCLSTQECFELEDELLEYYFLHLRNALNQKGLAFIDFEELENEWRFLYPFAWADFSRFLKGWMPTNSKLNEYSEQMVQKALVQLG